MATLRDPVYRDAWDYKSSVPTSEWEVVNTPNAYAPYQDDWSQTPQSSPVVSGQTTQGAVLDRPSPVYTPAPSGGANLSTPSPQMGQANSAANYPSLNKVTPWTSTVARTGSTTVGPSAGAAAAQPYATVQTSKTIYQGKAPTFAAPKWDEREVRKKARKLAGPAMAKMEQEVQRAVGQYYENPNVRRMVLRDTLQGYGIGLAGVIASSEQAATAAYGQEYGRQFQTAQANYNTAWAAYISTATQRTTVTPVYSKKELDRMMSTGVK